MKYVIYDLNWRGALGEQPYAVIADNGACFSGGIFVKDKVYFGYVIGNDEICNKAIKACEKDFLMKEITQKEALSFYESAFKVGNKVEDKYITDVNVDKSGIIGVDLSLTPPIL